MVPGKCGEGANSSGPLEDVVKTLPQGDTLTPGLGEFSTGHKLLSKPQVDGIIKAVCTLVNLRL